MMFPTDVNVLALLLGAIVPMILGMLWYSPLLFGEAWMKATGMTEAKAKKNNMARSMFVGFLTWLLTAYVLMILMSATGASTHLDAMALAGLIWVGFLVNNEMGAILWEQRPLSLFWINALYNLVTLLVVALLLSSMM